MAKVMTLGDAGLGARRSGEQCKCVHNPRTGRTARLCFVGKGPKTRSGWMFVKGAAQHCKR